ncbi:hypothetical protein T440DRAFT_520462 [Plenodomus tracheiphilus IPT5]|uniref:Uncharacterized protein n=1 Tax=Plenodomus tracheiphilus IPT5 TaxID=1408161 RepID=A0A6A7AXM4_9PLEO|nr:hypothetical protein T440DRAFT_520462 [Plenodomus tracheiphilus IPT5]
MADSNSTFQSFSTSYSSSSVNGQTKSHSETTYSDPSGTKIHRSTQEPGQAPRVERIETDSTGTRVWNNDNMGTRRIQDVMGEEDKADVQAHNNKVYEESIEDEYAKREGGA